MSYRLKYKKWCVDVLPEFGMNPIRIQYGEQDLVRTPTDLEELRANPYLWGFPLLFPANRTKNGTFPFRGTLYSLPVNEIPQNNHLHGVLVDAPFEVLYATESELSARYQNRGERYPFSFDITITDSLSEDGFLRTVQILALEDLPYTLAFHATFTEPKHFRVPLGAQYLRDENNIPTGKTISPLPLEKIVSGFYRSAGQEATLDEFTFAVSPNFDHWILYNGNGEEGFLCLEPQCGEVNGLNTDGHALLLSGNTETFTLRLKRNDS